MNARLNKQKAKFTNAPSLRLLDIRYQIIERQKRLRDYKDELESLNNKANLMFEHMKRINKLVDKKTNDMETELQASEGIFNDALN